MKDTKLGFFVSLTNEVQYNDLLYSRMSFDLISKAHMPYNKKLTDLIPLFWLTGNIKPRSRCIKRSERPQFHIFPYSPHSQ
jgi:hypothetical protein